MRLFYLILLFLIQVTVYCWDKTCRLAHPKPRQTVTEIVELCRGKQEIAGWSFEYKLEKISQEEFDDLFSDTLRIIAKFEFTASTAKQMIFPKLKEYLFNVRVPSSTTSFHHNNLVEIISFPKLKKIVAENGNVTFSHNPKLREIQFPIMERFLLHTGDFMVDKNSALQSFVMRNLEIIKFNNLIIRKNPQLQNVELECTGHPDYPTRPILAVLDKMIIEENESLKTVRVKGKTPGKVVWIQKLEIRKNWRLEKVEFEEFDEKSEMKIEGNPKLDGEALEKLKKAANSSWGRIQDYGECILEEEIAELAILDDCGYIYGDLRLAAGARGTVSGRLSRVEGRVDTSDLTVDRLEFLLDTEIYGQFESDLCDFDYSRFKSAKKGVRKRCSTEKKTTTTRKETTRTETTTKWTEKPTTIGRETTGTTEIEKETIGSTKGGEETTQRTETETIKETTIGGTTEEEREEMRTTTGEKEEEKSTERSSTELTPKADNLTRENEENDSRIVIIAVASAIAVALLVVAVRVAFFWYKKSKKKKEESSNGSESSSRPTQARSSRRNKEK